LPRGFMYYGGGHLHKRVEYVADDKKSAIIYPGPLFGSTFTDLENTATGEKRGFYIIEYDTESRTVEPLFIPIKLADIDLKVVDANGLTSKQTEDKISKIIKELDPVDKIFLLKVKGLMSMGKRSDIEFGKFEEEISLKGALISFINRSNLFSAESVGIKIPNRETNIENIEKTVIKERISLYKIDPSLKDMHAKEFVHSRLFSSSGENTADQLLRILKTEKIENETQRDYERRIISYVTSTVEI
jgi:DNA repair protein SbcD/Mre11